MHNKVYAAARIADALRTIAKFAPAFDNDPRVALDSTSVNHLHVTAAVFEAQFQFTYPTEAEKEQVRDSMDEAIHRADYWDAPDIVRRITERWTEADWRIAFDELYKPKEPTQRNGDSPWA